MRNNRETEIRSLKGPRRKLELELIDGKRYIKKRDLQHYFFDEKWTIPDFGYHFGLGHRIVRGSLYKWFTKEEIDRSHREKIAEKQKGDNNSNKVNWYRPSKLIPLTELENAIGSVHNKKELKEKLNLTSWELSYIQQFYNFRLPNHNTFIEDFSNHSLSKSEIKLMVKMMIVMGIDKEFLKGDLKDIHQAICKLIGLNFQLKYIIRKLKKYYREYDFNMPTNLIEYHFYNQLIKKYPDVIPQYFFKDLNIHVDFLIPSNKTILELDGHLHNLDKDRERDSQLISMGYKIIRIDLIKERLSRFVKPKDIIKCLRKYL